MNVHINTREVRHTGAHGYPSLADTFRSAQRRVEGGQNDHGAAAFLGSSLLSTWAGYNGLIALAIETSARHLDVCGDTLVDVADDHDWTDEDNSHHIDKAYASTPERESKRKVND